MRRFAFRHFVYLVNSSAITQQNDSSKFATIAVDFVDNLNFSCPLFHLRNVAYQWRRLTSQNGTKFDVTGALFIAPAYSRVRYRSPNFCPSVRSSVRSFVRSSVRQHLRRSLVFSTSEIAASLKPCIVIVLDIPFKHAP